MTGSSRKRGLRGTVAALAIAVAASGLNAVTPTELLAQGYNDVVSLDMHELGAIRDIRLAVNKSLVVDLPVDVKDVLVSGPDVADAVLKSTRKAFIIGGEIGQTNVFFFDALGDPVLTLNISVEPDFETLQLTMDRLMPHSDVRIEGMNNGVALYGEVADAAEAKRAVDLAAAFMSTDGVPNPETVVNMLTIRAGEQVMVKVTIA
ncbi:MAG: pilus assembly protein N-terminal domain-containing protein, partial [Pseudomonadota bacterium]